MKTLIMLRCRLVLLAGLLVLCGVVRGIAAEGSPRRLVSPELLKHARLKIVWESVLPIKKTESLKRLIILDNRIYALSNRNYMVSLDREKGDVIFSRSIAPAGFPIAGLELFRDELVSIIGNKLVEIDPESGTERRSKHLKLGIVCPAARNSGYFYLGGADRRLHTLRAENKVEVFKVAAENESMITSIIADEWFVVFATEAGNVISITPDRPIRLWQFDASGAIAGPIVRDGMSLFFASKDTNVYRVDMVDIFTRKLAWKYQTEAALERSPRVTQDVVYQYARDKALTAIDRNSGKFMWSLREGVDLLAEGAGKAYVISNIKTLVVMDNERAKKLYTVNFTEISRYAANTTDSKIYIADERGRIACIEPVE